MDPPKYSRPMVRWWWPGADVEEEELLRELAELDENGFGGAEIQALSSGMPRHLHRDRDRYEKVHRFMQPYYYEMVGAVLDEAKQRKLVIDLAVSSGWPTGGTYVKKEDAQQNLLFGYGAVLGGRRYRGPVPQAAAGSPMKAGRFMERWGIDRILPRGGGDLNKPELKYVVAACPQRRWDARSLRLFRLHTIRLDPSSFIDLTAHVDDDGLLEWEFPRGLWYIFAFYTRTMGTDLLSAAAAEDPEKEGLIIDHLSSAPLKRWLNHHFDRGKAHFEDHFGRRLCGFFIDNPRLNKGEAGLFWTANFKKEFRERRGYDIIPFLPVLFTPAQDYHYSLAPVAADRNTPRFDIGDHRIGDRVRYDYHLTVSDLFNEQFIATLAEWGRKNRLRSRVQAYGFRVDLLRAYGLSDMPVTEQNYAGGGMDFLKIAGSAAIIYDKPLVVAEAMGWCGREYKTTPLKWKVAADKLFTAGVNQLIYHGFPYQDPAADCPEAYPFSGPHVPASRSSSTNFSHINEFRAFFPTLNNYITRCQHILQQGKIVCNVALFFPLLGYPDMPPGREELSGGYLDECDAPVESGESGGKAGRKLTAAERWLKAQLKCTDNLSANGYYYTHINEESLLRGRAEGGKLLVGSGEIEAVLFNHIEYISLPLAKKLEELAAGGVKIIFMGAFPQQQPGYHEYQINEPRIKELMRALNEKEKAFVTEEMPAPILKAKGVLPNVVFEHEQPAIHYIHKRTAGNDYYFFRSSSSHSRRVKFSLPHGYRIPYILNPYTGEADEAPVYEAVGNHLLIELDFDPYGSYLLELKDLPSARRHHLLKAPQLKTIREENRLVAYASGQGEYSFILSHGETKRIIPAGPFPEPLKINRWQFDTVYRDVYGHVQEIALKMNELKDWRQIPALEHCSSRGRYEAELIMDESYFAADLNLLLSLGQVGDVAIVKCNGRELEPLLTPPYEADITPYLRIGENTLEIEVIPTLNNQLIGYGRQGGVAYRNHRHKKSLMPSGLIGPVMIIPRAKLYIT